MKTEWRISTANAVLLAAYIIPTWLIIAGRIIVSPIHGLFERPNISVAIFIGDHFHLAGPEMVRAAWLLALAKLTVVAFLALFVVLLMRAPKRDTGACDEALAIALTLGSIISFAGMVMASRVGEPEALRLHATELLLFLGSAIVMLVERPAANAVRAPRGRASNYPPMPQNS